MNTARSIKINFQGASREVDLPTPATLTALQAAVASAFGVELAARSKAGGADSDLSFTYMDSDGDDIVFDKDAELSLALRLCPSPLEVSAASKQLEKEEAAKPEEAKRIYRRAARNLREYHGVPSMTPPKLVRTLAFLQLHPRRLVRLGLAPAQLLAGAKAPQPLGSDSSDDLAEAVTSDMELMSVEDDRKEWNDGFVSVEEKPTDATDDKEAAADAGHSSSEEEEEEEGVGGDGAGAGAGKQGEQPKAKNVLHGAFLAAGIQLRPREIMPLFLALGVSPRRLVKLGRVDGKELRAVVQGFKRRHNRHHCGGHPGMHHHGHGHPGMHRGGHPGMAAHFRARGGGWRGFFGCMPGAPGSRGPGGKPCGPGRRHGGGGSPMEGMFFCPPPPPHHADSTHRGGGGPGGFCGPPHHGEAGHPGRFGGGGGVGCAFSPEMMVKMDARAARHMAARSARRGAGGGGRGGGGGCGGRGGAGGGGDGGHWYGYWG